jgi:hypothetical protein
LRQANHAETEQPEQPAAIVTTTQLSRVCLFDSQHCMSAAAPSAASHTKSLHLLRALLREATYLPDAVARPYFRRYIVNRFKAYQPSRNATASFDVEALEKYRHRSFKRRKLSVIKERTSKLQKKAQKGLHYMRRANQGEIPCLKKVLYFAYGRMGRRKYALLNDVLKPDPITDGGRVLAATDVEAPTPLQELYHSNKQFLQYFDAPKPASNGLQVINISDRYSRLRAVLKSQYQRGISIHRELKGPAMKTPTHNVWMRPMPIVRARNNVRRWYGETMTRFLPPLPIEEWDKLYAMINGTERISLVRRRTPGIDRKSVPATEAERSLEAVADGLSMDKLSKADRPSGMWRPHNITAKFMRRLYSRLFQLCCKVEYSDDHKHWVAVWGRPIQSISPRIYEASTEASLFAGVDIQGKPLKAPKTPKRSRSEFDTTMQPRNDKGEYVRFPFFTELLPRDNPLRQELDEWKKKRAAAGIVVEDGSFRGR